MGILFNTAWSPWLHWLLSNQVRPEGSSWSSSDGGETVQHWGKCLVPPRHQYPPATCRTGSEGRHSEGTSFIWDSIWAWCHSPWRVEWSGERNILYPPRPRWIHVGHHHCWDESGSQLVGCCYSGKCMYVPFPVCGKILEAQVHTVYSSIMLL